LTSRWTYSRAVLPVPEFPGRYHSVFPDSSFLSGKTLKSGNFLLLHFFCILLRLRVRPGTGTSYKPFLVYPVCVSYPLSTILSHIMHFRDAVSYPSPLIRVIPPIIARSAGYSKKRTDCEMPCTHAVQELIILHG
jgi:hypothetical protein